MPRDQIQAVILCSFALLGYANTSANAGWFGPSNYAECMLEKLKDGHSHGGYSVEYYAKKACALKFPCVDDAEFKKCMSEHSDENYCDTMICIGR